MRRRRCNTRPSAVGVKISGLDVVDGSVRIYVRSMAGGPGRGLSSAATMTRFWSPSSAGMGWLVACCVGGAGRDLRHVGVRGGDRCGAEPRNALMLRRQARAWRVGAVLEHGRSRRGWGMPMEGVVMGCDEPLARGGGARHTNRADWLGAHRVCRRAFRDAQVCCWWAGGPRRLSHACHKRRETWWDAGRCTETIDAGRRDGRGTVKLIGGLGDSGLSFACCA